MSQEIIGLDRFSADELRRLRKKVDTLSGDGVTNHPEYITISNPQRRPPPAPQLSAKVILYGKAAADWSSGNEVTLIPVVSKTDDTETGAPNVTAKIFSPERGTPVNVQIKQDDICAYVLTGTKDPETELDQAELVNPNFGTFTSLGTKKRQVYQMTTDTQANWDFIRAHA